jgi:NAD(P)-dependent dehydrogenase (short-subunit alcohol dehydrogenase family)
MFDLKGKVVMVTGSAGDIGAAVVRAVGAAGADVILHYGRSKKAAESLADEVGRERCHLLQADYHSTDEVIGLWRNAVAWKGHIDVLVNNAGIQKWGAVDGDFETWDAVWHETLQVNLLGMANLCREAILHFRERGGGILINVSSQVAHRGHSHPTGIQYAASKAGIKALSQSIARGFANENILVYILAPGVTKGSMSEDFASRLPGGPESITKNLPLGEWAEPDDIGAIAAFLATGKVRHATGTTIDITGAAYVR